MKEIKRVQAGAVLSNSPSGLISLQFTDFEDGGHFGLHPKVTENSLILVDPQRPHAYGVELGGSPEALKRVANALLSLARKQTGESDADAE